MNGAPRLLADWSHAEPSDLASAVEDRVVRGLPVLDLVTANPHEHGLAFPPDRLAKIVADALPRIGIYRPDAQGQRGAREAIGRYYAARGVADDAAHVIVTPGTSYAYWLAFRLLLDGGGEVLVPRPTYPLFEDLARLAGARTRSYHLRREGARWHLDVDEIAFQLTPATRAIAVVSPHNPTGHSLSRDECAALGKLCAERGLALVVDEVFAEFMHGHAEDFRPAREEFGFPLVLTLNGISKMLSLPGWKGGWIAATGERARVEPLVRTLAYANDTFLPAGELVQAMLPALLDESMDVARGFAAEYRARMIAMRAVIPQMLGEHFSRDQIAALTIGDPDGGVYLPIIGDMFAAHDFAERFVRDTGMHVHSGSLYGIDEPSIVTTCVHSRFAAP